jgi:hypothetical protein
MSNAALKPVEKPNQKVKDELASRKVNDRFKIGWLHILGDTRLTCYRSLLLLLL